MFGLYWLSNSFGCSGKHVGCVRVCFFFALAIPVMKVLQISSIISLIFRNRQLKTHLAEEELMRIFFLLLVEMEVCRQTHGW